jgi:hypothetical protein
MEHNKYGTSSFLSVLGRASFCYFLHAHVEGKERRYIAVTKRVIGILNRFKGPHL